MNCPRNKLAAQTLNVAWTTRKGLRAGQDSEGTNNTGEIGYCTSFRNPFQVSEKPESTLYCSNPFAAWQYMYTITSHCTTMGIYPVAALVSVKEAS